MGRTEELLVQPGEESLRLDKFISVKVDGFTRSAAEKLIQEGAAEVLPGGRRGPDPAPYS